MLSSRNMTSSIRPSSPPVLFGWRAVLVVLQSQMDCYPTTCSNEAATAAQNETIVLMMVGSLDLFSLVLALV